MEIEEVLHELGSSLQGLSSVEAENRLRVYGFNELEKRKKSIITMLIKQFMSFLILILIIASIVALFLGEVIDASVILAIVMLMGVMGFVQEYRAEKTVEKLQELASPMSRVIRDNSVKEIAAKYLVPGDIIVLREGDKVPADARLIEANNLEVDESPLTGESIPVEKNAETILPLNTSVADRKNMVFMGTYIVRGRGKAIVVATGMKTELGKIARQVQEVSEEKTILEKELDKFGKRIGVILIAICSIVFILSIVIRSEPIVDSLLLAIALAVAAVPEGLPAIATIVLALGAWRMAKRKALVKRLAAVETLGACNVICSDKTGTITKGEMTVRKLWIYDKYFEVEGVGYEPRGKIINIEREEGEILRQFAELLAAHTSVDVSIERVNGSWIAKGSPTEAAVLVLAYKVLGTKGIEKARRSLRIVRIIPFDRFRKRKTTIHELGKETIVVSSGAPEIILDHCSTIMNLKGDIEPLTTGLRAKVLKVIEELASQGYRTLAVAQKILDSIPSSDKELESNLTLLTVMGIIDPPRENVKESIETARKAGIKVMMVTGDHKLTAIAVAKMVGMDLDGSLVIEGRELDSMSDSELEKIIDKVTIFARVTPEHKARIVKALKRRGYVVAMTGDGVNDAPALKLADIGVAMGIRGTDVAKEAAQLILLDDNFATIVEAVKEGRVIYENLKKPINYLLTCNLGEVATIFGSELLGLPAALTAPQLLWINITTDAFPALALGLEPPEPGVMEVPPRGRRTALITNRKIMYYIAMGSLLGLLVLLIYTFLIRLDVKIARTAAFTAIAFSEFGRAFASRSERLPQWRLRFNKWIVPAVLLSAALQLMVLYVPPLSILFDTMPLPLFILPLIFIVPLVIYVVDEVRKLMGVSL
ncbi:MAG: ATPase [Thermoprotei archaeon]|nr:MAG: ATPase [Thermoprotei archaeon]